jgi:hypothetical protein
MPATLIAERMGWQRGLTVLKDRVRELRPAYLPPDPASRTAYDPGELAQCDFWFPPATVPVGFGQERGHDAAAGPDDGQRLLPLAIGGAGPVPARGRPVRGLVAADLPARGGAAGVGLGREDR